MASCSRVLSKTASKKSAKIIFLVLFEKKHLELFPLKKEIGLSEVQNLRILQRIQPTNQLQLFLGGSREKRREALMTWDDWIFISMP